MAALGRYSYGIYIWHIAAAHFVLGVLPGGGYHQATPVVQVIKYGSAITVGVLATVLVERPVLRLRDRLAPPSVRCRRRAGTCVAVPPGTPAVQRTGRALSGPVGIGSLR